MLNGSPNPERNTNAALEEIASVLNTEGIESDIFRLGNGPIRDCIGCGGCAKGIGCVFTDDKVNDFTQIAKGCDGFVFGMPVYYTHHTYFNAPVWVADGAFLLLGKNQTAFLIGVYRRLCLASMTGSCA